ncbi:UDP-2,3-diacylglucosamine diphosphatase [Flavihumibacter petaseus]|uniref:Putative hydrolase n=1 Tax=Flavihumibacter petaseus NBRC 106054 TaxID=1220578 RepID=A0A0E9MWJ7_9BACT|nr:UDP-2,3-diacylglucosamine diphosphatase [Flavihumibacter petaseus]GAO41816.1 putative hydrolase [Flavihumibacter petaseus NBRC 106054]
MLLEPGKKIYFISDFHLGAPDYQQSLTREKKIVRFLETIEKDAATIFIVGDLFDFWYEYRSVVPKGYVRILGKLANLTDKGIAIHFFVGNHDMWMKGYFERELSIPVYHEEKAFSFNGKSFLIGHGDGLGPGDHGYKFIKKVFRNRISQFLFGILHPTWGIGLANYFSRKSRAATGQTDEHFLGEDNEWLITYCKDVLQAKHYDFFVFGHRHLPIDFRLPGNSRYINLGDWLRYDSYAVFDGQDMELKYYQP